MPTDFMLNPTGWRNAPYIEQWLGVWAMREAEFSATAEMFRSFNLSVHLAGPGPEAARDRGNAGPSMSVSDSVALIELRGRMQKQESSVGASASTVSTRRAIRAAVADPEVGSILMVIDSPGGTVAGTKELADEIASAAKSKPVIALIEDIGASAAYWVASQATTVLAQATASVGSIGTYGVVYDMSAAAAKDGIKVHVVRAGAMKGAGTPGTEVTPEQIAAFQKEVNTLNEFFVAGVAQGRNLPVDRVRALATGDIWIGQEAVAAGLIDAVSTFDQALATARSAATAKGKMKMAAATYAEIVAACPGATAEFICDQLKAGATVEQSSKDFMAWQALQIEAGKKQLAEMQAAADAKAKADAEAAAAAKAKESLGVDPLKQGAAPGASSESAWDEFQAAVDAKVAKGMPRPKAVAATVRENPERHAALVASANSRKAG